VYVRTRNKDGYISAWVAIFVIIWRSDDDEFFNAQIENAVYLVSLT